MRYLIVSEFEYRVGNELFRGTAFPETQRFDPISHWVMASVCETVRTGQMDLPAAALLRDIRSNAKSTLSGTLDSRLVGWVSGGISDRRSNRAVAYQMREQNEFVLVPSEGRRYRCRQLSGNCNGPLCLEAVEPSPTIHSQELVVSGGLHF